VFRIGHKNAITSISNVRKRSSILETFVNHLFSLCAPDSNQVLSWKYYYIKFDVPVETLSWVLQIWLEEPRTLGIVERLDGRSLCPRLRPSRYPWVILKGEKWTNLAVTIKQQQILYTLILALHKKFVISIERMHSPKLFIGARHLAHSLIRLWLRAPQFWHVFPTRNSPQNWQLFLTEGLIWLHEGHTLKLLP
jgi:hypothetical protein